MSYGMQMYTASGKPILYEKGFTPQVLYQGIQPPSWGSSFLVPAPLGTFTMIYHPIRPVVSPAGGGEGFYALAQDCFTVTTEAGGTRYTQNVYTNIENIFVHALLNNQVQVSYGINLFNADGTVKISGIPSTTSVFRERLTNSKFLVFTSADKMAGYKIVAEWPDYSFIQTPITHLFKLPKSAYPVIPHICIEIPSYPHGASLVGGIREDSTHWLVGVSATIGHNPVIYTFDKIGNYGQSGYGISILDSAGNIIVDSNKGTMYSTVTNPLSITSNDMLAGTTNANETERSFTNTDLPNETLITTFNSSGLGGITALIDLGKNSATVGYIVGLMGTVLSRFSQYEVRVLTRRVWWGATQGYSMAAINTTFPGTVVNNVLFSSVEPYL